MATTRESLITADDFLRMDLGDGTFELVRGRIVMLPPGTPLHGRFCADVAFALGRFGRESGYGYVLINDSAVQTEHDPDTVRGADVCFYSEVRWRRSEVGRSIPPVLPDLVVEVGTPDDRRQDLPQKLREYVGAGVLMTWIVDPETRTFAIYRHADTAPLYYLNESDTIADLPELPGFACRVADFFL